MYFITGQRHPIRPTNVQQTPSKDTAQLNLREEERNNEVRPKI